MNKAQHLEITNRLLSNRESLKNAFGNEYKDMIATPISVLKRVMNKTGCNAINAFMKICDAPGATGTDVIVFGSAYIEITEEEVVNGSSKS